MENHAKPFKSPEPGPFGPVMHGGDLYAAESRFGRPAHPAGWLDLSTGINPVAYDPGPVPAQSMARLPGSAEMDGLLAAAGKYYAVAPGAEIIAAPGSQALVGRVPYAFAPATVSILGPTYAEHEPAWKVAGHSVSNHFTTCEQAAGTTRYALVVNPNNPTTYHHPLDGLQALAEEMFERGGALVVDEAFMDTAPEFSLCPHAGSEGLVVLRSFGKFFGLAGIRLGFAVAGPITAGRIREQLGPWAVSGPAIWVATRALADDKWINATRERIKTDSARLEKLLRDAGMETRGNAGLFVLAMHDEAQDIYERLGRAGILARPFVENPKWLRFGLPADDDEFARLESALKP